MGRNYINNRDLYECIAEYHGRRRDAESQGRDRPPMPNYVGECIMLLCRRMSTRYNFRNYSFREDMEADAIADCTNGFYNFDPDRFRNPFGYFSQVAWSAMIRRIGTEKKETYLKYKSLQNAVLAGAVFDSPEGYTDSGAKRPASDGPDWMDIMDNVVSDFEANLERRRQRTLERRAERPAKQDEPVANTVLRFAEEG